MSKLLAIVNSPVEQVEITELTSEQAIPITTCFFPDLEKTLDQIVLTKYEGIGAISPISSYQEKAEAILKKCLTKQETNNEKD